MRRRIAEQARETPTDGATTRPVDGRWWSPPALGRLRLLDVQLAAGLLRSLASDDYRRCHHLRRVIRHRLLPKTSTSTTMTTMISIASQIFI
jgi:hypothetical protein